MSFTVGTLKNLLSLAPSVALDIILVFSTAIGSTTPASLVLGSGYQPFGDCLVVVGSLVSLFGSAQHFEYSHYRTYVPLRVHIILEWLLDIMVAIGAGPVMIAIVIQFIIDRFCPNSRSGVGSPLRLLTVTTVSMSVILKVTLLCGTVFGSATPASLVLGSWSHPIGDCVFVVGSMVSLLDNALAVEMPVIAASFTWTVACFIVFGKWIFCADI